MKNTLNTKSSTSTEENTVPSVNGVDCEGRESEEIDILIENGPNDDQDEDDTDMFGPCPGDYSSRGVQSDSISNGERPPPRRKLSDGHISRGSFLSPLNISQTLLEVNPTENGKRRSMLEDYVLSNNPSQRKERIYAVDHSQAKPHFHYSTNSPTGGFDRFHSHPATRSVGRGRAKKESLEGPGAYRQLSRKSDNPRPGYWSGKDYRSSYTGPLSQSAVPPDNVTTPFGIPYSKLSQAKHLKSKLGASSLDSRRRGHGPPGHKDL
ncbi:unnamed protein product [Ranitomeya imitator]|uniref:Uncharacterized protein n=1 Tax=Ranitomeya imitator TaxID=111125 RepID=A0ABN9KR61_9NEOB|nr:unnamed protein product [Ranitomeya imitator]